MATPSLLSTPMQDIFAQLPKEILLDILKLCPNLSTLRSVIIASPTVFRLSESTALEMVEAIISATVPASTQRLMRMVLLTRTPYYPRLAEARNVTKDPPASFSNGDIPTAKTLRSFLSLIHKIHFLGYACIDYYIQAAKEMRPSTLIKLGLYRGPAYIEEMYESAESREYQPVTTEPPSWVEEQRVIRALWRVQLYLELNQAREARCLDWSNEELQDLATTSLRDFYTIASWEVQQIQTVYEFLQHSMPDPSPEVLQLPTIPGGTTNTTCAPPKSYGFREDHFQQNPHYLDHPPMSIRFQSLMANAPKHTPLPGMPFDPYRKFGFAIWDDKRMTALGFAEPGRKAMLNFTNYYFTWRSVLTAQERSLRR